MFTAVSPGVTVGPWDVLAVMDQVTDYGAEIERTGQLVADVSLKYGVSVSRVFTSE